ncbi:LysM peptidoglycan-binding domain-containing protein [Bacillus sp. B190/17]|uniref:LysM peptidoglycan-binding domain-containing protein n=1 Tax=Bacillus lumedeiriae TaxID=3058829 RepID=A0ABW8I6D2_9BACI
MMTIDPYRELAKKTRVEIQKVKPEREEQPIQGSSRMERKEQNKQRNYPLLKALLVFFLTLPVVTLFWYTYTKEHSRSSTTVVTEHSEAVIPAYAEAGKEENQPEQKDEENASEGDQEKEEITEERTEPVQEPAADVREEPQEVSKQQTEGQTKLAAVPLKAKEDAVQEMTKSENEPAEKEEKELKPSDEKPVEGKVVYHTVKPQETVFRISMMYYKSQAGIEEIRRANHLNGNDIRVGQVLKIPLP